MEKLKFNDLTEAQEKLICNGCGPKAWGGMSAPQFLFRASCNQHDFYYWRGGTEDDRKLADSQFYEFMKKDIENAPIWKKPHYHIWAYTYYKLVSIGGKKYFHYSDKQRTMEDLLAITNG